MKKKTIRLFVLVLLLLLCSCGTTKQDIILAPSHSGQMIFIRPTELKCMNANSGVHNLIMDITVPSNQSVIEGDSTVNYSLIVDLDTPVDYENVMLEFQVGDSLFVSQSNSLMYKEQYSGNKILIRFTSTLAQSDFATLYLHYPEVQVSAIISGSKYSFAPDALIEKLSAVQFYIK